MINHPVMTTSSFQPSSKLVLGIFILFGSLVFTSCSQPAEKETTEPVEEVKAELPHLGEAAFKSNCYACHNDFAKGDARLAPPMMAVKTHYESEYPEKEDFIQAISSFVTHPSAEKALLADAVERFGLMLPLAYSEEDLYNISEYIWETEFKHPGQGMSADDVESMTPIMKGKHYASSTKALLGKNLIGKIQSEGTLAALEFCNTKAIHFTDSMSTHHGVSIKRVSDLPRNPSNQASDEELKIIGEWKAKLKNGESVEPLLTSVDGTFNFYGPITTNPMCLQCHGSASDIQPEVKEGLSTLYPEDKALGYGASELRGIWSITWSEE
jgi:mono/diheme cytochrome c family protein